MLLEYNTCRHAAKTDVCVCVMKRAGMAKAFRCSGSCQVAGVLVIEWQRESRFLFLHEESVYVTQ